MTQNVHVDKKCMSSTLSSIDSNRSIVDIFIETSMSVVTLALSTNFRLSRLMANTLKPWLAVFVRTMESLKQMGLK